MASKTLTLNKLVSSDFSEGNSWVLNKGGGGDTDVGYFVFNSIGVSSVRITNVSFKINAIETGGNNIFGENIYLNFEFGTYSGSTFTKSSAFSFSRQGVKESENQVSRTATASGSADMSGDNLCIKLTITPQSNSVGSKIVMSGFSLTVTYEEALKYTVTVNANPTEGGTVTGVGSYTSGETAKVTANPANGYKFVGWANQSGVITVTTNPYSFTVRANTTFTAVFEKLTYTVRWYNEDGTKLLEEDTGVPYGDMPDCSVIPTKEATAEHTYKFIGWQIDTVSEGITELTAVVKEINYYARFREIVNTYIVTWKNGDTVLETDEAVPYGTTPDYNGITPTKVSTPQYDYTFLGWNTEVDEKPRQEEDLDDVTGHITYTAVFLPVLRKYPIEILYDENICTVTGAVSGEYEHGTKLTLTVTPKTGYYFDSWGFDWWHDNSANVNDNPMTFTVLGEERVFPLILKKAPEFTDVEMIYCGKQISEQNKVISGQGFIISAIVI